MKLKLTYVLSLVFIFSTASIKASAESIAFGYFINKSGNDSLNYLEKILPNSFASSLKNKYDIDVVKPSQMQFLTDKDDPDEFINIREEDLHLLNDELDADYFVFGHFMIIENNKMKLSINVYKKDTNSIFQYEDTGYLETEIFKLVDKIALQIKNLTNDSMIYKSNVIESKSKLAIITNIDGEDLNSLYYEFLSKGYKLSPIQGNDLHGIIGSNEINKLYHISGTNASYHIIHDKNEIELMYDTWTGADNAKKILNRKKVFEQFAFNYDSTCNEFFKKIKAFDKDSTDYLIIIGFDDDRTNAWIRCISLKDRKFLIAETGIEGTSVNEITQKVINSITTGLSAGK